MATFFVKKLGLVWRVGGLSRHYPSFNCVAHQLFLQLQERFAERSLLRSPIYRVLPQPTSSTTASADSCKHIVEKERGQLVRLSSGFIIVVGQGLGILQGVVKSLIRRTRELG